MKSIVFFIMLIFCFLGLQAQSNLEAQFQNFISDPNLKSAGISFQLKEVNTNKVIFEHQPNLSLSTASTAKLFSTAGAIDILGPNYQPRTRLYIDGTINSNGELLGNLWVRGGGDPTLGSKYFNAYGKELDFLNSWLLAIQQSGIKKITGKIIVDGSEFGYEGVPDGWAWSDIGNYYGAGFGGICIADNLMKYHFQTGAVAGEVCTLTYTDPKLPDFKFTNYIQNAKITNDKSIIYGAPFSSDRFGTGFLPMNRNDYVVKGSLPDPEAYLAQVLYEHLTKNQIPVTEKFAPFRTNQLVKNNYLEFQLIHTHMGPKLSEIAKETNHRSINLFAESMLGLIGYQKMGKGTLKEGVRFLKQYFGNKLKFNGLFIEDGSGLSRSNAVSAADFTTLLNYMAQSINYKSFLQTLPTVGVSGTVSDLCVKQIAAGKIQAKSGTMERVKSYAGYVTTLSGKKLSFSIIINNYSCSNYQIVSKIERIMNEMVRVL